MSSRQIRLPQSGEMTVTVLLGLAVILFFGWQISNSIAAGAIQSALLLFAAIAALGATGRILSDWRSGLNIFLAWLLFEDLVRKYLGNSMYIYFGKDALVAAIYLSLVTARQRGEAKLFRVPFKFPLILFFVLGLAQVFNSGSPSIWYGMLGLKLYFFYIPLMFVGYALIRTEKDLHRFLVMNMGLAIVIALIGTIQAIFGVDFLNPHSGADIEELSHVVRGTQSGLVVARPTGVFVSDGRFGQYLILSFILGLGTAGYLLLRKGSGRKITFSALALIGVAAMLSGLRGAVVASVASALVLSAAMLWGAPKRLVEGYRLVKAIRRSFVFVALALALTVTIFPDVVGARWAFYEETLSPNSPEFELGHRTWNYPFDELVKAFDDPNWVMGHGIGTASLGGQYVKRIMEAPATNVAVENGFGTIMLELGILGPILWLGWTLPLLYAGWGIVVKLKGTWGLPLAASIVWFAFFLLIAITWGGIGGFENFVLNAYLWLLVGILFRLPELVAEKPMEEPPPPVPAEA